jgi:ubiquinone/menaquinone biosynthesis C-methylase UbiE
MGRSKFHEGRVWCINPVGGTVLELGFGAGANLSYYTQGVATLYALEPSIELFAHASDENQDISIVHLEAEAEQIPLPDASVDFVVSTWTLCSVTDVVKVAREVKRVLKASGELRFVEHGKSKNKYLSFLQKIVNPIWKSAAGGCELDREYFSHFERAGFVFSERQNTGSAYRGVAVVNCPKTAFTP